MCSLTVPSGAAVWQVGERSGRVLDAHPQVVRDNFKLNATAKPEDVPRLMSNVSTCYRLTPLHVWLYATAGRLLPRSRSYVTRHAMVRTGADFRYVLRPERQPGFERLPCTAGAALPAPLLVQSYDGGSAGRCDVAVLRGKLS